MTEDKAEKALRKVIINLIPDGRSEKVAPDDVFMRVDISDKLEDGMRYWLHSVEVDYDTRGDSIRFVTYEALQRFKSTVEDILDATIVNAKQRESVQKLLYNAYCDASGSGKAII